MQQQDSEIAISSSTTGYPNGNRGEVELYDLAGDRSKTTNVATQHLEEVQRLTGRAKVWDATLPTKYEKTDDKQD